MRRYPHATTGLDDFLLICRRKKSMFKWKASPSASWHSPKDHASKQEQNPASTSHTEINSFLRFQRRNPASDCTGIAGRPRGGNKAKQNKSNRIRRANAVAKHKQRGGGAWIRARTGSRIPRPTPGGFHLNKQPRAESQPPCAQQQIR